MQYLPRCYVLGEYPETSSRLKIQSQCICEHCWEYRTLLIQFCGNNKQVVKGVHCQCNVNTTDTSLYTNEQWTKDTGRQGTVVHCQCNVNTTDKSLYTNEQWIILLKDRKKSFTVNLLEIQYFTTDKAGTLTSSG